MNKYLTIKNIVLTVAIIASIVFFVLWLGGNRKPVDNTTAEKILKEQLDSLKAEQSRQKIVDSTRWADYLKTKKEGAVIIEKAKVKRDEKINRIDTAGDAELRRILAED